MNDMQSLPAPVAQHALTAFSHAALTIAGELSLEKVLYQITESARILANARYAALGVPTADGELAEFVNVGIHPTDAAAIGKLPTGKGLLGAIMNEGVSIRVPRISDDPRSVGFPPHHPPMESFLGVPIKAGDDVLGNLYLTEKIDGNEFTEEDQRLIEVLAAHAAIAIRNARLYAQVGRLAVVEERSRIGMDLHDGVIQSIYAVGLTLESLRMSLSDDPPNNTETDHMLEVAIGGLNDAIRDIRNFILDLRPQRFSGNLVQGFERLAREFQTNAMVPIDLIVPPADEVSLPPIVARTLFLTTQEALANIARHAGAAQVTIELQLTDQNVTLIIADDGVGFNTVTTTHVTGHGLANMRTRTEELGGNIRFISAPGKGTTITIQLPTQ